MSDGPLQRGGRDLTEGSLYRNLFRLGWPLATGALLHAFYNVVDAFWLGRLSKEALGAPGATAPILFVAIGFGMGFGQAGSALVAQHTGACRPHDARRAAGQTFVLLVLCSLAFALPIIIFARPLLRLYQLPEANMADTLGYLRVFMLALPLMAFNMAYNSALRALGDTLTMVMINLIANVLNVVLDPLLIFTLEMGTTGAAAATVISHGAGALICVVLLRRGHSSLRVRLRDLRPAVDVMKQILGVGVPGGAAMAGNAFGFVLYHTMVNYLGSIVLAAFTVANRIAMFVVIPGQAMALAAAPIVGQALGAGNPDLARRAVRESVRLTALLLLVPYALLTWKGYVAARLFTDNAEVVRETTRFFLVVPAGNYPYMLSMVLGAAFYGSGHTRPILAVTLVRQFLLLLPVSWTLIFIFGLDSMGLYFGFMTGNVIAAGITWWLFRRGRWLRAVVETQEDEEPEEEPPEEAESLSGDESGPSLR